MGIIKAYPLFFWGGGGGERRANFTAVKRHFRTASWKTGVPCPPSTWAMTKAKFAAKAGAGRAAWGVSALPPSHRLWPRACRQTVPQPAGPSLDPTLLAQTGPGSAHLHLCSANPSCKPPGLGTSLCTVWDRGVVCPVFCIWGAFGACHG